MTRTISLADFEARFRSDPDPWRTYSRRREAVKRRQLLEAAGARCWSRGLELGAGNGSNSPALARRTLRLDVCEGTASGAALVRKAVADCPNVKVYQHILPGRFPSPVYDLIVISEVLYYLQSNDLKKLSREISRSLAPRGRLLLAHHHQRFADARTDGMHAERILLDNIAAPLHPVFLRRNHLWIITGWDRAPQ